MFDKRTLHQIKIDAVKVRVAIYGGNVSKAARSLGISSRAIRYWFKDLPKDDDNERETLPGTVSDGVGPLPEN